MLYDSINRYNGSHILLFELQTDISVQIARFNDIQIDYRLSYEIYRKINLSLLLT